MEKKKKINIGEIAGSIIALISSRLVFGGLFAFLGIRVAINPGSAPNKISWGLGLAIIVAMVGLLAGFITTKSFTRTNLIPIIESITFTILGICMIIFDKAIGPLIEELFFVVVIINSVIELLYLFNFRDIKSRIDKRSEERETRDAEKNKKVVQDVGNAIRDDFHKYNADFIKAGDYVKKKVDGITWIQIAINVVLIVVSVVMLVTRFAGMNQVYFISGIVMVISGVNEMVLAIRGFMARRRDEKSSKQNSTICL